MKTFNAKFLLALGVSMALAFSGCASGSSQPQAENFDQPSQLSTPVPEQGKGLFSNALKAQKAGQYETAIQLWTDFLAQNPNSHEGHSNLGLVYENQNMISQALQEFEKAYRLQPIDPKIRQNLVRAMRFKANLHHENREYFKTLEILARLEKIVLPREKQGVLFKQEQVEDQIFLQVIKTDDVAAYEDFVQRFPDGLNAVRAWEFLEKNSHQLAKGTSKKKNRKYRRPGMNQSVESGNLSAGTSSQAPPQYGTPSYYGSSQPSATYTPPSAQPAQGAGSRKKKIDIFGLDPSATEGISEDTMTAPQGAVAENQIAIPFEDFEKPERISGDTAKDLKHSPGEDPADRTQPEVLADAPDTLPDLESTRPLVAEAEMESPDIQMEQTTQQTGPAAFAEPVESGEEASVAVTSPVENTEPATAMAEAPTAEPEAPETAPVEAVTEVPPAEPEMDVSAIEQAIREAEAELAQAAEMAKDSGAPEAMAMTEDAPAEPVVVVAEPAAPETSEEPPMAVASVDPATQTAPVMEPPASAPVEEAVTPPVPSAAEVIDKETISQTVASLVTTPKPEAAGPENTVVVIQVGQGSTLNVRAGPSGSAEILGFLENGDMMPFVKESKGWYQLKIEDGLFGWVSSKFSTTRTLASAGSMEFEGEAETQAAATEIPGPAADDSIAAAGSMVEITVAEDSSLNVRSMPSSEGAVVDSLAGGDTLPLIKESGDWYQLQFEDGSTGWVSKKYSKIQSGGAEAEMSFPEVETGGPVMADESPAQDSKTPITTVVVITVKEGSSLRVRSAPSSQGEVLGSLQSGEMRPLIEESGDWYQVEFQDGQSGWVSQKFSSKLNVESNVIPQE